MEQFRFDNINNMNNNKFKLCIVYFIFVILILILLVINYITTKDKFKENFQINLNSTGICRNYTMQLDDCSKHMPGVGNCSIFQDNITNCELSVSRYSIIQVEEFNKKCSVYSSELNLCLNRADYDCEDIYYDLMACNIWNDFLLLTKAIFKSQTDDNLL